ncbi:hypothetical protein GCM10022221_01860 [Actinocorallia aurea]
MRTFAAVAVASAVALAPLAVTSPASAAGVCTTDKMPSFKKVIDVRPGGVGKVTRKHPYGALSGRYTKRKYIEEVDMYVHVPTGKKKTVLFAKNAQICVLYTSDVGGVKMKRTGLKGLAKAVDHPAMNPQWGLRFNGKGRITVAYQIYMP